MSWLRAGLGSIGLGSIAVTAGFALILLADNPVQAKSMPAAHPMRRDFFLLSAAMPQQKGNFPKVDPKDEIPLPEGPGKDTTKRLCGNCHSTDVWVKQRHTPAKWSGIIDNMIALGMEASDDDIATVNDYLGKYLPPAVKETPPPASPQK